MNAIADKFAQWDAAYVLAHCLSERRSSRSTWPAVQPVRLLFRNWPPSPACWLRSHQRTQRCRWRTTARRTPNPGVGCCPARCDRSGPPPSLLPKMIKTVRTRRRRIVAAVAGIAAAVLFVIGGIAVGTGLPRWDRTTRIGSHFHQSRRRGSRQSLTSFRSKTAPRSRWNACTPRLTIRDPAALKRPIRSSWSTGPVRPRRSRNGPRPRTSRCDRVAPLR